MNQSGHEKPDFDVWGQKAPPKQQSGGRKRPQNVKGYWFNARNKVVNWALSKERLINWGFYDLATAYQSMHGNY